MSGVRCFMVERTNERTTHRERPLEERCDDPSCSSCAEGWDETLFDVRRLDSGEVLATNLSYMIGAKLLPGAMWYASVTEQNRPTDPCDYAGYTPEDLDRIRTHFAEHQQGYTQGPCVNDPTLPARHPSHTFIDGPMLNVVLPNLHSWNIDSRASNCGSPYDYEHRCWVRHGAPPVVTVDKAGMTCAAGAGSIQSGDWHGFLRGGELVM